MVLANIYGKPIQHFLDRLEFDILRESVPGDLGPDRLRELGIEHAQSGNLGRALSFFERRRVLLEAASPTPETAAQARTDLALVLKRLGKLRHAKEELEECLRLERLSRRILTRCLDLLAGVEREMRSYRLARLHAGEALRLARESEDPVMAAHCENTLGNILFDSGDPDGASRHYETAVAVFEREGDRRSLAVTAANYGNCLVAARKFDRGIPWIRKSLEIARGDGFPRLVADALSGLARAYFRKGDLARCNDFAFESIASARKGDYFDILFTAYFYLWRAAKAGGQPVEERRLLKSLRYFRSKLEGTFPEVQEFDRGTAPEGKGDPDA
ncbi:MAG: tetratricopeptide repeat protein [Acidobacteria bacterium]|nr:tetratricopeptide repeat protein [Acidobacteriota bacterium]